MSGALLLALLASASALNLSAVLPSRRHHGHHGHHHGHRAVMLRRGDEEAGGANLLVASYEPSDGTAAEPSGGEEVAIASRAAESGAGEGGGDGEVSALPDGSGNAMDDAAVDGPEEPAVKVNELAPDHYWDYLKAGPEEPPVKVRELAPEHYWESYQAGPEDAPVKIHELAPKIMWDYHQQLKALEHQAQDLQAQIDSMNETAYTKKIGTAEAAAAEEASPELAEMLSDMRQEMYEFATPVFTPVLRERLAEVRLKEAQLRAKILGMPEDAQEPEEPEKKTSTSTWVIVIVASAALLSGVVALHLILPRFGGAPRHQQ